MSEHLLDKITNEIAFTEGKADGHGIGLTQVRETIQANKGEFNIVSTEGAGTSVILKFPRLAAPTWIVESITLNEGDIVIVLDDDPSIHDAWTSRFENFTSKVKLVHFDIGEDVIKFFANQSPKEKEKYFLLSDFELLKQELDGLQVIEKTQIRRFILVTSHDQNNALRERANRTATKILPKLLLFEVPVKILRSGGK